MSTIAITVTTAPGKPVLDVPASLSHRDIARVVLGHFGMQVSPDVGGQPFALPHSYCGKLDPAPAPADKAPSIQLLVNPGHLRAI